MDGSRSSGHTGDCSRHTAASLSTKLWALMADGQPRLFSASSCIAVACTSPPTTSPTLRPSEPGPALDDSAIHRSQSWRGASHNTGQLVGASAVRR